MPRNASPSSTKGAPKRDAIVAYYAEHKGAKRADVAAACGCTVQRVGEVVRSGAVPRKNLPR